MEAGTQNVQMLHFFNHNIPSGQLSSTSKYLKCDFLMSGISGSFYDNLKYISSI